MTTSPSPIEAMVAETAAPFALGEFLRELGFFMRPAIEAYDEDHAWLHFYFRTTSWDFPGERSDIHDLVPLAVAAILRGKQICCCEIIDEANPAVPELGEIYGRFLLPSQPLGPLFTVEERDAFEELLQSATLAEKTVWEALASSEPASNEGFKFKESSPWANEVREAARQAAEDALAYERDVPAWDYFHAPRSRLTVVRCEPLAHIVREAGEAIGSDECLRTEEGLFFSDGPFQNFVPVAVLKRAQRLLRRLETQMQLDGREPALVPLEGRVLVAGETHLASVPADCGRFAFARARARVSRRRQEEARLLYGPHSFKWVDSIPPDRFEELVRALLKASGDVSWVRSAGPTNERDQGRDLVAEWWRPAVEGVVPKGMQPGLPVRAVVQCKTRSKTVGKAMVRDVRDTLERHDAQGYFLAVSTTISSDLTDYLIGLREKTGGFVDWWTRDEIEDELRRNPEITERFRDLVVPINPSVKPSSSAG